MAAITSRISSAFISYGSAILLGLFLEAFSSNANDRPVNWTLFPSSYIARPFSGLEIEYGHLDIPHTIYLLSFAIFSSSPAVH